VEFTAAADPAVYTEELVITDTLTNNYVKFAAAVNPPLSTTRSSSLSTPSPTTARSLLQSPPLPTPRPTNVVLAEKYQIAKKAETVQNAKSKIATHTWINFLKKICPKSKKIAAEVYSVEVEIEK
jgi:hypothetical protein